MSHQPPNTLLRLLRERYARKEFWIITLVALLLLALATRLCLWQLNRAEQKQQLQAQLAQTAQLPVWANAQLLQAAPPRAEAAAANPMAAEVQKLALGLPDAHWLYHPVRISGQWLPAQTVYLENRPMQGKTGFWIFTPLALSGSDKLLWVQRAWVPRDLRARNLVPALATPSGTVWLQGQLQGQPSALASLGAEAEERTSTGATLRLNLDWQTLQAAAGGRMLPFTVREVASGQGDGLGRDWDMPPLGIAKHQGYAFQWAGMGLVLLGLYLWFQLLLPLRQLRARAREAALSAQA